jgi:hypothetical protein
MALSDSHHPIWRIGKILSVGLLVIGVNYFRAQKFDKDDVDRILLILGPMGLGAGIKSWLNGSSKDGGSDACLQQKPKKK